MKVLFAGKLNKALGLGIGVLGTVAAIAPMTAAASTDYSNMFAGASTEALAAVTAVVPVALGVFAVILGIRIGQRLFKQFAK
jgi:TRAP-type C4-dicarboxylate transport system permease small subunit